MNLFFERAIQKAQTLSDDRQKEVGEMLLALVEQDQSHLFLNQAQETEVRRRLTLAEGTVPVQEMDAFFRKLAG